MDSIDINTLIMIKQGYDGLRDDFIDSNKGFIRRIASYICKRNLDWSNDDELSIALMAFNEAIDSYDPNRGTEFTSFCIMLMRSRLIDFFRKNNASSLSLSAMDDEHLNLIEAKEAQDRYSITNAAEERGIEIRLFNEELSQYGLSMADLTVSCPKHRDTRKMLFEIAAKCGQNKEIIRYLKKNKMLSIKEVIELTGVKRKFLEQWRRYLIALLIIASSDEYLYLKEYIDFGNERVVI
ncbi:RNA polymerase sigma factor SigI [Oxobacter pfennigii]|uniref:RNA polymerase sigma factor SigI n=1 Tax=Oxobacter pfennigii TaxID=36849 RepID=A0A0N8NSS3_9CLOT|nr:RNA polymerase sigma-I factor [Oxobacter pfennigii]KPU42832.1 RNA polymerase sigma factor SigI [Oxobacter pfennigii]